MKRSITVYLDKPQFERLYALSASSHMPVTKIVAFLIDEWMSREPAPHSRPVVGVITREAEA